MDERMEVDFVRPFFQLFFRGELSVQNQISDFEIGTFLGKLLDRIAAVTKNTFIAVDERDRALAKRGVHKCRVIRHHPEIITFYFDLP